MAGKLYNPASLVVAVRETLVWVLVAVINAPWIAAPLASRTSPLISPNVWPNRARLRLTINVPSRNNIVRIETSQDAGKPLYPALKRESKGEWKSGSPEAGKPGSRKPGSRESVKSGSQ